jgi:hypothetical protein
MKAQPATHRCYKEKEQRSSQIGSASQGTRSKERAQMGDRLRITAQLLRTADISSLVAELRSQAHDVFAIQEKSAIAEALSIQPRSAPAINRNGLHRTWSLRHYLQPALIALRITGQPSTCHWLLERAAKRSGSQRKAHLADVHAADRYWVGRNEGSLDEAEKAARKALNRRFNRDCTCRPCRCAARPVPVAGSKRKTGGQLTQPARC